MSWVAVAVGGAALVGSIMNNNAQADALSAQKRAAKDANQTQRDMFNQQRADLEPWRQAGIGALSGLDSNEFQRDFTMNDFNADPGYQFRMQEGQKAIEAAASARGGMGSGGTLKALTKYGQDYASNEYDKVRNRWVDDRTTRFNRLASVAGLGQTATNTGVNAAGNYGNAVAANQIGVGNASAANSIATANNNSQMLEQVAGAYAAYESPNGVAFSDERLKKNIEPVSSEDLNEMKKHLKAYSFNYVHSNFGSGDWIGVMAQDLEKSKLGRTLVIEDEDGHKQIDTRKVMSLFLATMAEA